MSRSWRITLVTVASVAVVAVGLGAFGVFYWVPRGELQATERAKVASPVGSATFAELIRDPDRFEGRVLTLEGIVDDLWSRAAVEFDPTDTTVYPAPETLPGPTVGAAY